MLGLHRRNGRSALRTQRLDEALLLRLLLRLDRRDQLRLLLCPFLCLVLILMRLDRRDQLRLLLRLVFGLVRLDRLEELNLLLGPLDAVTTHASFGVSCGRRFGELGALIRI